MQTLLNKHMVKTYVKFLVLTLFFSLYFLVYEWYLHDSFYVAYLPKHHAFPTYDITGKISNLDENPVSDNLWSYLPWYSKVQHFMGILAFFLRPILLIITLILGLRAYLAKKLSHKWYVILIHLIIIELILVLIFMSPISD